MHVKGLELSAYDPRGSFAQGVEYATTNRGGCHVQGASMYLESVGPLTINPQNLKLKADIPIVQQNLACAINSMVLCIFTTYGIDPRARCTTWIRTRSPTAWRRPCSRTAARCIRTIMGIKGKPMMWFEKWLTYITGRRSRRGHLQEIGERIFNLERMYNLREGLTGADDTLPPRMLHEPTFKRMTGGHPLAQLLPRYYKLRGWDAHGVPTRRTLEQPAGAGLRDTGDEAMPITVELTYDMSKALGVERFDVEGARTVDDVVRLTRKRFGEQAAQFEQLARVAAVVVNGVLVNHRRGMKTRARRRRHGGVRQGRRRRLSGRAPPPLPTHPPYGRTTATGAVGRTAAQPRQISHGGTDSERGEHPARQTRRHQRQDLRRARLPARGMGPPAPGVAGALVPPAPATGRSGRSPSTPTSSRSRSSPRRSAAPAASSCSRRRPKPPGRASRKTHRCACWSTWTRRSTATTASSSATGSRRGPSAASSSGSRRSPASCSTISPKDGGESQCDFVRRHRRAASRCA